MFRIDFANHTDKTLKVKGRMGMVKTIKPKLNPYNRTMYSLDGSPPGVGVKITVSINIEDIAENLAELEKSKLTSALSAELLYALRMELDFYEKKPIHQTNHIKAVCVEVLFLIPEYDLGRGYKYFPELDMTFGLFHYSEEAPLVPHPNTQDKLTRGADNHLDYFHKGGDDDESLTVSVKVTEDVPGTYNRRYVSVMGEIYKVPISPTRGSEKEGVYVKRNFASMSLGKEANRNQTMFFTLDEARDKFGLDTTIEAAAVGGDLKLLAELELTEKKKEIEEFKAKAARDKHDLDMEKYRLDVIERKEKMAMDRRKAIVDLKIKLNDALNKTSGKPNPDNILGSLTNFIKGVTGFMTASLGLSALG